MGRQLRETAANFFAWSLGQFDRTLLTTVHSAPRLPLGEFLLAWRNLGGLTGILRQGHDPE